jgi:hypothetical protein
MVAELRERMKWLEAELERRRGDDHRWEQHTADDRHKQRRLSRSGLLKGAAAGIAGLAAAELAGSMGATPAAAAEDTIFAAGGGSGTAFISGSSGGNGISNYDYGVDVTRGGIVNGFDVPPNIAGVLAAGQQVGVKGTGPTGVQGVSDAATNSGTGIGIEAIGGDVGLSASGDTYGITAVTNGAGGYAVYATTPSGYGVYADSTSGTGVRSFGGTYGVWGLSGNGFGVHGDSDANTGVAGVGGIYGVWGKNVSSGTGVYGENDGSGYGVYGYSTNNIGIWGNSPNGVGGQFGGGKAPLLLLPAGTAGPPTSGSHYLGELYVDGNGILFSCTANGTPGAWRRLSSTVPIPTVRVLNTRPGKQIGPYTGPIANNTVLTLTLAGTNGIPANATGVMGNLTAADATGSCFLALVPSGANHLGVSSINFPAQAPGTGLANAFTVGLSSDGKIDIYTGNCGNYTVNIIMDITAFII